MSAAEPWHAARRDLKLSNLLLTHDGTLKLCGKALSYKACTSSVLLLAALLVRWQVCSRTYSGQAEPSRYQADFGLARSFRAFEEAYTPRVVTLWYRCVRAG